jgi:Bacterial PH domain
LTLPPAGEKLAPSSSEGTGAVAITQDEIEREKKTLPFGWGRFGKSIEQLAEISEPNESLLASCVALNPEYRQGGRFVPGTLASAVSELTKSTNVVLGCTNERLIMLATGVTGAPRKHISLSYEGMEIVERESRLFVLETPAGRIKVRSAAKQQVPLFLQALEGRLGAQPDSAPATS